MKSAVWTLFPLLAVSCAIPFAHAADLSPSMTADIWTGTEGSTPSFLAATGTAVFFQAAEALHGGELWKTDGTDDGTVLVRDIWPGPSYGNPGFMTAMGATVFFTANDGEHGDELWKSDGTEAGTVMVKDINPLDGAGSYPENLVVLDSILYFTADDGTHGVELWKSDGTAKGTDLVRDINHDDASADPAHLTVLGSMLFFQANDQLNNQELWSSDGTAAGTVLVKDINPGNDAGSLPDDLTAMDGVLYFRADDGVHGGELWRSDGTEDGTWMVKDIAVNFVVSSDPYELRVLGSTLYFFAFDDASSYGLWSSDGTTDGTVLVKDIDGTDYTDSLTVAGNQLFFRASDGVHGGELWKSNGTATGTVMVKDINPAPDGDNGSYPSFLTVIGTTVFFSADDGTNGFELWKSNGTASGTLMVADLNPGPDSSYPESLLAVDAGLYFNATDGTNGVELWGFVPDILAPTGTILINNNRSATNNPNVTLALTWSDGDGLGVGRMRFSSDGATWSAWEPPAASRTYALPEGDGHKTVRVQFRDAAANISPTYTDYIRLDTTPPTGSIMINGGAISTTDPLVTLSLSWSDGAGAGVSRMRFSDDGAHWTMWEPPQTAVQHLLPLPPGGYQTVRVQFRDGADNISVRYSDYIRLNEE